MDWDWEKSIDVHGKALRWIVMVLFAMAGLVSGAVVETLPRRVHRAILHTLIQAEAAVRRLIILATRVGMTGSHDMTWEGPGPRKRRGKGHSGDGKRSGDFVPAFPLNDPRKPVGPPKQKTAPGKGPRIRYLDEPFDPSYDRKVPMPDDPVSAVRLCLRLLALKAALDDLPAQARRMMRVLSRRKRKWPTPLRRGHPPGHRARGKEPVDVILADCQILALWALGEREKG